jgi:phosphoribosylformylglycinamidine cyclo-ligase
VAERRDGSEPALSYAGSGVDRQRADRAKAGIARLLQSTGTADVLSHPGGFGGLYRVPSGFHAPVLVASADGVGTKLKVAIQAGRHDTVGQDLVNHCVNDILVEGAVPLFFLDYIGMGRLDEGVTAAVVEGIVRGCQANGCALLGGETAELPGLYAAGDYDLAGFIVGVVEEAGRPGADRVSPGDVLVGLESNGFHTNGYSLLRALLFQRLGLGVDDPFPGGEASIADVLLQVHRSYLGPVLPLIRAGDVHALAHITGGGLPDNLARVLPDGLEARVRRGTWPVPPEFDAVQQLGGIAEAEMMTTFNMGLGMVLVVPAGSLVPIVQRLASAGLHAWEIGTVERGTRGVVLE